MPEKSQLLSAQASDPLDGPAGQGSDPLELAVAVAPVIRESADHSERLRTMAPEAVAALRDAGLFWLIVPTDCGGMGADVLGLLAVVETLARADGSSGWTMMANSLLTGLAAAYCSDDAVHEMFGGSPRPVMAGMLGPGGRAIEVDGGMVGSGAYSFGSGAGHADWFGAGMIVTDDGRPRTLPSGDVDVRVCVVPRSAVELRGNWDTMGLAGTGSFDYVVAERFIPEGFTFERSTTQPRRGGPLFQIGIPGFACAGHTAVALGITARALEEIAVLAGTKRRPGYAGTIADHPLFRQDFSRHEAAFEAMRSYTFDVYRQAQAVLRSGETLTDELRQRFRQSATYVHATAADIVRFCYTWGGSDALRNPSPLGRCMRDISGATQHVFVDPVTMVDAAPSLIAHWAGHAHDPTCGWLHPSRTVHAAK